MRLTFSTVRSLLITTRRTEEAEMLDEGWYPDPNRRHELRWFDGEHWTTSVMDGGQAGQNDPSPLAAPGAPVRLPTAPAPAGSSRP